MTRIYDPQGYRRIPADSKGYQGVTEYKLDDYRTIQCLGVGAEVDAAILTKAVTVQPSI